jgi:hypothetical protein
MGVDISGFFLSYTWRILFFSPFLQAQGQFGHFWGTARNTTVQNCQKLARLSGLGDCKEHYSTKPPKNWRRVTGRKGRLAPLRSCHSCHFFCHFHPFLAFPRRREEERHFNIEYDISVIFFISVKTAIHQTGQGKKR